MAKRSAMEVRALSPPDNIVSPRIRFLGNDTSMSIPLCSIFFSFSSASKSSFEFSIFNLPARFASRVEAGGEFSIVMSLAVPPPNISEKKLLKALFIFSIPSLNSIFNRSSSSAKSCFNDFDEVCKSLSSFSKNASRSLVSPNSFIVSSPPAAPNSSSRIFILSTSRLLSSCFCLFSFKISSSGISKLAKPVIALPNSTPASSTSIKKFVSVNFNRLSFSINTSFCARKSVSSVERRNISFSASRPESFSFSSNARS